MIGIFFVIIDDLVFGVDHLEAAAPVVGFDQAVKDDLLSGLENLAEIGLIEPFCCQGAAPIGYDDRKNFETGSSRACRHYFRFDYLSGDGLNLS